MVQHAHNVLVPGARLATHSATRSPASSVCEVPVVAFGYPNHHGAFEVWTAVCSVGQNWRRPSPGTFRLDPGCAFTTFVVLEKRIANPVEHRRFNVGADGIALEHAT